MTTFPSVLIVGIGNVLLGDEGLGIHVLNRLKHLNLPSSVALLNCGTDLLSIQNFYAGEKRIIILDAIQAGRKPGTLHCIRKYDFDRFLGKTESAHQLSAVEAVMLLEKMFPEYSGVEFIILGIEPESTSVGQALSPAVAVVVPALLEKIKDLLGVQENTA